MLRTLEGRVGSGKTTRVLREVAQAAARGERVLMIVPEQLTLSAELQLADALSAPGFLLAEVLSPTRLLRRVNEAVGGLAGRVIIDEQGRAMALRAALSELDDSLSVLRGAGGKMGFVEWLADVLTEFSQGDIGSTELRLAADALKDGPTRMKLYDLAAVNDRYLDTLEGRFLDTAEATELFLGNVKRADFLSGARVWVDGFDIMPPRTLRMMVGLAVAAREVTIALTLPEGDERGEGLFEPVAQSFGRLAALAQEAGIPLSREALAREAYQSAEIGHLEREWDAHPVEAWLGVPRSIELVAAPTPREECDLAAAAMLALHRDEGVSFGDMACVLGDEESYAPLMRRALNAREIPAFIAQPLTAAFHPAARWWLWAMQAAATGMRGGEMARVLRSGWSGAGEDEADQLMNLLFTHGLAGRAWERPLAEDAAVDAAREKAIAPLLRYAARVKGRPSAGDMARAAYLLLEEAEIYPRLMQKIDSCNARGEGVQAEQHAQVWNRMLDILDQAVELLADRAIPHAEFLLALEAGLESAQLAALPPRPDQVMVTSISRVKGSGIQALFLLGLNDGVLPSAPASEGLLGGDEREAINLAYQKIGSPSRLNGATERDQAEHFSVYCAITLPTRRLYLSYASTGEDGAAMRPSILLNRVRAIFPRLTATSAPSSAEEGGLPALWKAASALREGSADDEQLAAWRYFLAAPQYRSDVLAARDALLPVQAPTNLSPAVAEELFGRRSIGVTRLERFALCPFRHFVQNGLRPMPLYEPGLRPLDVGSLYHAALDALTGAVAHEGVAWEAIDEGLLGALLERTMDPLIAQAAQTPGYEGGRAAARLREIRRTLHKTARVVAFQLKGSLFVPIGKEIPFGRDMPYPPLELTLDDGGKIELEGRIDRVDFYRHGRDSLLRVIDYKSGNAKLDVQAIEQGLALQLPLYAVVAERALGGETAGFFYCKIADAVAEAPDGEGEPETRLFARAHKLSGLMLEDGGIARAMDAELDKGDRLPARLKKDGTFYANSGVLAREDLRALLLGAQNTAAKLAARMLGGEAAPDPAHTGGGTACDTCEYAGICGKGF